MLPVQSSLRNGTWESAGLDSRGSLDPKPWNVIFLYTK
jgi:hypothetical protein